MPTALELTAYNALRAAAEAEVGVVIRAEQPPSSERMIAVALRAKQVLYRFRKEFGEARFLALQIRLSPDDPDNELWLIKAALSLDPSLLEA